MDQIEVDRVGGLSPERIGRSDFVTTLAESRKSVKFPRPALRGHLDAFTTTGYLEGWAYDKNAVERPLHLEVLRNGEPIASGLAHRYRSDLVDAGCGTGWCAFRLRFEEPISRLKTGIYVLRDLCSRVEFCETRDLRLMPDGADEIPTVDALLDEDPTVAVSIEQLRGCGEIFNRYIQVEGVESFVRCMYSYILNRPADVAGATLYASHIRRSTLTPFQIAEALADSDEYRSRKPALAAPTVPGFPFNVTK